MMSIMFIKMAITTIYTHHQLNYCRVYSSLPINGRLSAVGGIASVTNMRKTVIERSVVMPIATFSPESDGI